FGIDVGAPPAVTFPNLVGNHDGHVPRAWHERAALSPPVCAAPAAKLLLDERVETALEDFGQIGTRYGVAQKLQGLFELGMERGAGRELYPVRRLVERLHSRPRRKGTLLGTGNFRARAGRVARSERRQRRLAGD